MIRNITPFSEAEGIFFPAFDRHLCKDEEISVMGARKERQWDGLSFQGGNHFEILWQGEVALEEYDIFECFLSVPPGARLSGKAVVDGKEQTLFCGLEGEEAPLDISAPLKKGAQGVLTEVRLQMDSKADKNVVLLSWMGTACAKRLPILEKRRPVWEEEKMDRLLISVPGELKENLVFPVEEGGKLKDSVRAEQKARKFFEERAEEAMKIHPEDVLGEYVPVAPHMYRFVRKKDRNRPLLEGPILNLAIAGWLLERENYSRRAAQLILAMLQMKWFEGPVCEWEASDFHHVCFTEEHLLTELVLSCGFLKGVFTDQAWMMIAEKAEAVWKFVRSKCMEPGYRNYMNQGVVGCRGVALGAALLQNLKGGFEEYLEEAYAHHTCLVENYLSEDGHCAEGGDYFEYSFSTSIVLWHMYALYKGCSAAEVVPQRFRKAGKYLEALMCAGDRIGRRIPVNCGGGVPCSTLLLVFMTMVCDFPEGNSYLTARFAGEGIEDTQNAFDFLFYLYYRDKIDLQPYTRPYQSSVVFPQGGLAAYRRGNVKLLITAERNPMTGHFHEDRGGIVLEADGDMLLPELGTTSYANPRCILMEKKEYHNLACPANMEMTVESVRGRNAAAMAAFPITEELRLEDMDTPQAGLAVNQADERGCRFRVETGRLYGENIRGVRCGTLKDNELNLWDTWEFPEEEELNITFLSFEPWRMQGNTADSGRLNLSVEYTGNWRFETEEGMTNFEGKPVHILRICTEQGRNHEIHTCLRWSKKKLSPKNSCRDNTMALQSLLDCGGTIRIEEPGIYEIEDTLQIKSHTHLICGAGVVLRRSASSVGSFAMINRGAFTGEWDTDITIEGMHLETNGVEARHHAAVYGLTGELSFFRVKHLRICDFVSTDLPPLSFGIHVCTFEDLVIERVRIEGRKDAVHLGTGKRFVIRRGLFRTFDDPIALNAHDYAVANPQMGWIEDGLIEDCYDLADKETTGYFCRILAGSWCDWHEGMEIQNSDTVVSNGRLYRAFQKPDGKIYRSMTAPSHTEGMRTLDGIHWVMAQEDVVYNCGCRNIHFKDIHLQKQRDKALSIHFDHDQYSRSVYPGSEMPVQENIVFENLTVENKVDCLVRSITPVDAVRILNSSLTEGGIELECLPGQEGNYPDTRILISGNYLRGKTKSQLVRCDDGRSCSFKAVGNITEDSSYTGEISGDITVQQSDLILERT